MRKLISLWGVGCLTFFPNIHAANLTGDSVTRLSRAPLFIRQGVEPNLIVTLDDSASMGSGKIGSIPEKTGSGSNKRTSRRLLSYTRNKLYYSPDETYLAPLQADGTPIPTSFTRAYIDGYQHDLDGDSNDDFIDLSKDYRPVKSFSPNRGSAGQSYWEHPEGSKTAGTAAYYYKFDSSNPGCSGGNATNNDSCYDKTAIPTEKRQNFANWYSFYRTRWLATETAVHLAFYSMDDSVRVGWQGMMTCFLSDETPSEACQINGTPVDNRVKPFSKTHRDNFLAWVRSVQLKNSTPTREAFRRAGKWYQKTDGDGPYAIYDKDGNLVTETITDPDTGEVTEVAQIASSGASSCRRNNQILMTDGAYTTESYKKGPDGEIRGSRQYTPATVKSLVDLYADTELLDADNRSFTLGDGLTNYNGNRRPYVSSNEKTLADLAFYYWANDLAPNALENNLQSRMEHTGGFWDARNNPATWQHMVNYTMGLGIGSFFTEAQFNGNTFSGDYLKISAGDMNWPIYEDNQGYVKEKVYDLWHAAVNSRGAFYNINKPASLTRAFADILKLIDAGSFSFSQTGFSGATIATAKLAFSSSFNSKHWSGDISTTLTQKMATPDIYDSANNLVSVASVLEQQSARNIKFSRKNDDGDYQLFDFDWSKLNDSEKAFFNSDTLGSTDNKGQDRLNWIKGSRGDSASKGFRVDTSRFADMVNAAPVFVGAPDSIGLSSLPGNEGRAYKTFYKNQENRSARLYAAGNGGMLHVFNADSSELTVSDDQNIPTIASDDFLKETFAYIPSQMMQSIARLSDPEYVHQFYLDVTPTVEDVYISGEWKTVLIGGMRGARSIYALDITDPTDIKLMWELNSDDSALLGHTYAKPVIARLNDGHWYALVSNGYDARSNGPDSNGKAALLMIKISDGSLVKTIETPVGTPENPNGLSEVTLADINGDLITDYAYAGDLFGNLWRFDLNKPSQSNPFKSGSSTDWKLGLAGQPLFSAVSSSGTPQPITSKPYIVRHSSQPGHVVLVGTGKYIEDEDHLHASAIANSFYGIWDQQTDGYKSDAVTITRDDLLQQTSLLTEAYRFDGNSYAIRTTTSHQPRWNAADPDQVQQGWFLDFVPGSSSGAGEMVISNGAVRGDLLLFQTAQPSVSPCERNSLNNWLYGINPVSGSRVSFPQFDLSKDEVLDTQDQKTIAGGHQSVSAIQLNRLGMPTILGDFIYFSRVGGVTRIRYQSGPRRNGRQNWQNLY